MKYKNEPSADDALSPQTTSPVELSLDELARVHGGGGAVSLRSAGSQQLSRNYQQRDVLATRQPAPAHTPIDLSVCDLGTFDFDKCLG